MPPQGRLTLRQITEPPPPPPREGRLPTTPFRVTNPRLATLEDFVLSALGLRDGLAPDASKASTLGTLAGLIGPAAVVGALKGSSRVASGVRTARQPIKAYHGSPYDFEKFSLAKIGTGEGAQAYGHGLYFAENEGVARNYRDALTGGRKIPGAATGRSKFVVNDTEMPTGMSGHRALDTSQDMEGLAYYIKSGSDEMAKYVRGQIEGRIARWRAEGKGQGSAYEDMEALANYYERHMKNATAANIKEKGPGRMYEVAIKASPDDFLDWDKPLSQQSEKVQEALKGLKIGDSDVDGFREAARTPEGTRLLSAAGIKGIRYKDAGSRGGNVDQWIVTSPSGMTRAFPTEAEAVAQAKRSAGSKIQAPTATSNYVVFDDQIIDIMKKYGIALPAAAALKAYQDQMRPEPSHQKRR